MHLLLTIPMLALASSLAAQWHQASPATNPGPAADGALCANPSGPLLFYGGGVNQTWFYDGFAWAPLPTVGSPGPRIGCELIYDSLRDIHVIYGSMNTSPFGGPSNDTTWELNGITWAPVTTATTPGGLGNYGACFDSVRNKLVLYGGTADSFFPIASAGTWEYDGTNWTAIAGAAQPGPLERPAMCFHAGLGKTVLFGGIDPQIGGVDTTWLYAGTTWTAAPVVGPKPPVRTGAKMAYDTVRGVCVLVGGVDPTSGALLNDTWEFDGTAWTQVPTGFPTVPTDFRRWGASVSYLPNLRQVVRYGGYTASSGVGDDTWHYGAEVHGVGSGCAGSNGVPAIFTNQAAHIGEPLTLTLSNLPVAINIGVLVFGLVEVPGVSLASIGMPGCLAYATPDLLLTVVGAAGSASWTWPSVPNALDWPLVVQGLSLDPGVNPLSLASSSALVFTIGQ